MLPASMQGTSGHVNVVDASVPNDSDDAALQVLNVTGPPEAHVEGLTENSLYGFLVTYRDGNGTMSRLMSALAVNTTGLRAHRQATSTMCL